MGSIQINRDNQYEVQYNEHDKLIDHLEFRLLLTGEFRHHDLKFEFYHILRKLFH